MVAIEIPPALLAVAFGGGGLVGDGAFDGAGGEGGVSDGALGGFAGLEVFDVVPADGVAVFGFGVFGGSGRRGE